MRNEQKHGLEEDEVEAYNKRVARANIFLILICRLVELLGHVWSFITTQFGCRNIIFDWHLTLEPNCNSKSKRRGRKLIKLYLTVKSEHFGVSDNKDKLIASVSLSRNLNVKFGSAMYMATDNRLKGLNVH